MLDLAVTTLKELVTPQGIYASSNKGEAGRYHALFGRDTCITEAFIHQAEKLSGNKQFSDLAIKSVIRLAQWQGKQEDLLIREHVGKIPHEIWEDSRQTEHLVKGRLEAGLKPFYVDRKKISYVNYFSNDSTPLWIIEVCRAHNDSRGIINKELEEVLYQALNWCIHNIHENDGFAGYVYDPHNTYHEPAIQSWKDSEKALLMEDGTIPKQPIKDVGVNGFMWAALRHGSEYFKDKDPEFSAHLLDQSLQLKEKFNDIHGFLMEDPVSAFYFSDALDGSNMKVKGIASDPALCMWAAVDGECIIEDRYIPNVVARIMSEDFFDPEAGIRIYSTRNTVFDPEEYHRGQNTYWPFVSGLIAWGFDTFGYKKEAQIILKAMLEGVKKFDSCIEMFLKKDNKYVRYMEPNTNQVSSTDQAWTAGAIYCAKAYLKQTTA